MWTSTDLFRASVLWWAASSSRYRWLKPWGGGLLVSPSLAQPRDCTLRVRPPRVATRRRPATTVTSWGLDPVVIHVSQPLLESLACCGRPRPRVAIAGPNRSGCGRHPPRVVIRGRPATSRTLLEGQFDSVVIRGRPAPCAELARCGRRRPRVTIVVQTLWPAASSSRYRWLKPWAAASSCRHRWLNPVVVP